jgi:hypothetical protein
MCLGTVSSSSPRPPVWILVIALSCCPVAASHGQQNSQAEQDRLVLLDGTTITGTISAIRSDGKIALDHAENPVELNGLRRIERAAGAPEGKLAGNEGSSLVLDFLDGGRLIAPGLSISDEQCRVPWQHGTLRLPLDAVLAVRLHPGESRPDFEEALRRGEQYDRLFVQTDEKLVMIPGFIEGLDDENVVFKWNDQRQTIGRARLFGIVVASVGPAPDHTGQCLLDLSDGSALWGRIECLEPGDQSQPAGLKFHLCDDTDVTIPWDSVRRVSVRSDRLVYLSDLTPVEVDEEPVVAFPRSWQRDKSVGRRPLTLGARTFAKGIGVQARSQLTLHAGGEFELLTATIGIDAETGGRGDCLFVVLGDGEELFRKRVKGADPPSDLRVGIQGVGEVALVVEPGEDLDFGDHADWCDACFIRSSK